MKGKLLVINSFLLFLVLEYRFFYNKTSWMKHIKTTSEFNAVNEQLFGGAIKKFAQQLFGKSGNDDTGSSDLDNQPTGKMEDPKTVGDLGKFTAGKDKTSPLVVVYGGIDVGGRKSGEYMYDYFSATGNSYNLFIARDAKIDGKKAYEDLKSNLEKEGIKPSKKILYLFSGGWGPGKKLLESVGAKEFDKIYLVDIWMGNSASSDFYKNLVKNNKQKVEYYYTSSGASNDSARKDLITFAPVAVQNKQNDHMSTNKDALVSLTKSV